MNNPPPPQGYNPNFDPRYAQRNTPAPPFPVPSSRDYDAESELGDHYASVNSSSARLAGGPPYYDHSNGIPFSFIHTLVTHSLFLLQETSLTSMLVSTVLQSTLMQACRVPTKNRLSVPQITTQHGLQTVRSPCQQKK